MKVAAADGRLQGKVLWFSIRDGNGIIKDEAGNEYYTDISLIKDRLPLKPGSQVSFEKGKSGDTKDAVPLARSVQPVTAAKDGKMSAKKLLDCSAAAELMTTELQNALDAVSAFKKVYNKDFLNIDKDIEKLHHQLEEATATAEIIYDDIEEERLKD